MTKTVSNDTSGHLSWLNRVDRLKFKKYIDEFGYDALYESAFLANLMSGTEMAFEKDADSIFEEYDALFNKSQVLHDVLARLRIRLRTLVKACRNLKEKEGINQSGVESLYTSYEAILNLQNLKQHWLLYRHAANELHENRMHQSIKLNQIERVIRGKQRIIKK